MTHTIIVEVVIAILGTFFIMGPVLYLIVYGLPRWMVPRRWRREAVEFTPSDSGIFLVPVVPVAGAGDLEAGNERAGKEQCGGRNG